MNISETDKSIRDLYIHEMGTSKRVGLNKQNTYTKKIYIWNTDLL
jgi:hypothetical protein